MAPAGVPASTIVVPSRGSWPGTVVGVGARAMTGRSDFDAFFEAHYGRLVGSLGAAFGDSEAADEAVQDAFIRAYARWSRVRRLDAPAAWVRRVAINRLRDGHRSRLRRERAEDRAADHGARGVQADPVADGPDQWDVVRRALAYLPERQRIAVALYYVEDLSVRDIAMSMRISEGAVKAHLSQGRSKLAAVLDTPEAQRVEELERVEVLDRG